MIGLIFQHGPFPKRDIFIHSSPMIEKGSKWALRAGPHKNRMCLLEGENLPPGEKALGGTAHKSIGFERAFNLLLP